MNKKTDMPQYVKILIKNNPKIVSGRKNFYQHHQRITSTIKIIKEYSLYSSQMNNSCGFNWKKRKIIYTENNENKKITARLLWEINFRKDFWIIFKL